MIGLKGECRLALAFVCLLVLLGPSAALTCGDNGDEEAVLQIRIVQPTGSTEAYFNSFLCGSSTTCDGVSVQAVTSSSADSYTLVKLTGQTLALEAALSYTADVRAYYLYSQGETFTTGDATAGVSASAVYLITPTIATTLFDSTTTSLYNVHIKEVASCAASTGFWGISLVLIVPIAWLLFRYAMYTGGVSEKEKMFAIVQAGGVYSGAAVPPAAGAAENTYFPQGQPSAEGAAAAAQPLPVATPSHAYEQQQVANEGYQYADEQQQLQQYAESDPQQYVSEETGADAYVLPPEENDLHDNGGEEAPQYTVEEYMDPETGEVYEVYIDNATGEMYRYEDEGGEAGEDANQAQEG